MPKGVGYGKPKRSTAKKAKKGAKKMVKARKTGAKRKALGTGMARKASEAALKRRRQTEKAAGYK